MAGDYRKEILDAMQELQGSAVASPQPFLGSFPATAGNDTDPLMRALQAAVAIQSANENETVPQGDPRLTNPLERAIYPGS